MSSKRPAHQAPASPGALNNAQVIASCQVPATRSIYILGCLERRVTLYSQQVRALNLVAALLDAEIVTTRSRVAIIGAGAAGLTAAAALALELPDIAALDVYERRPDPLHLQRSSRDRYLHPHIYDWPHEGSLRADAGLPVLNWTAGPAEKVAEQILDAMRGIEEARPNVVNLRTQHEVDGIIAFKYGGCRVRVAAGTPARDIYDVALLSVGFGYERLMDLDERIRSYWDASLLVGPRRTSVAEGTVLISGNGDGGLVDFMIAAFDGRSQQEILDYITGRPDLDDAKRVLLEIEEEAWRLASDIDLYTEYERRLPAVLPSGLWRDLESMLRRDVEVVFHTREPQLFRRDTAVLNRFAAYLAIAADEHMKRHKIRPLAGYEFADSALGKRVRFADGSSVSPSERYLRFGNDLDTHLRPFKEHVDPLRTARSGVASEYCPATPPLTREASQRFSTHVVHRVPDVAHSAAASADLATRPRGLSLTLSPGEHGSVTWSSSISTTNVRAIWADGAPDVILTCHMTPEEAGPLRHVVARLLLHARSYRLFCRDTHAWNDFLREFTRNRRPGPGVPVKFTMRPSDGCPATLEYTEVTSSDELAARIQLALDFDVLERLHTMVCQCLRVVDPLSMGWPIEPGLRSLMKDEWQRWYKTLMSSEGKRRRFLVLLACPDDEVDIGVAGLVRVGPKYIDPHLLRATIFALAFAACTEAGVGPSAGFPGNLSASSLSAHALGVAWLNGEDLGPSVSSLHWTTNVVLLSELRDVAFVEQHLPRLDRSEDAAPSAAAVPRHEQALIMGCTHDVRAALKSGASAVREYFGAALASRARAAAAMLQ